MTSLRTDPREVVRWTARWRLSSGALAAGEIQDISPQGAFVRPMAAGADVAVGACIELFFTAPGQEPLAIRGTIRWLGHSAAHGCDGFGIQFDEVNAAVRAYVNRPARSAVG